LGNEHRLEIIRVLWREGAAHEYDDGQVTADTIPYSALQTAVGITDNGKFNYHLSQLSPHFVRRTSDGYRLSGAGKQIARTVIAISGTDRVDLAPELEADCPLCGAAVAATYEDQWLRIRCTECDGLFGDQAPTGTLFLTNYPAAGLDARDPEDALAAGLYRCALDITYMMYGICRECGGPISVSVTVCDVHKPANPQPCSVCGTPFPVWADMRCDTCGFAKWLPIEMFATGLIMATGPTDNQALDIHFLTFEEAVDILQNEVDISVSNNPLRITLTVEVGPTDFSHTLDDNMTVIDFDRNPPTDGGTP
jgi:hypothetical protein